jgi:hypothetical protein
MDCLKALIISKDENDVWSIVIPERKSNTGTEKDRDGQ